MNKSNDRNILLPDEEKQQDYQSRSRDAHARHSQGIERVKTTPPPRGQKFPPGTRVKIADKLPEWMSHFIAGKCATVEHTYAHAFGHDLDDPGDNVKEYSLDIDGHGSSAWYYECQLTALEEGFDKGRE